MKYKVNAIIPNPKSHDFAVLGDSRGRNMVIELVVGSSAIDLNTGHIISFDWEPYGPGVAKNVTTDKEINVVVKATNLTPQEVKNQWFPAYPL